LDIRFSPVPVLQVNARLPQPGSTKKTLEIVTETAFGH
jgi:hypothetical protein